MLRHKDPAPHLHGHHRSNHHRRSNKCSSANHTKMTTSSPTGSPFQRRQNKEFSSFCTVHPPPNPMRMRTRNDEEFYGGFRRSSSLRRSTNEGQQGQHLSRGLYPGRAERTQNHHRSTSSNYRNNNNNNSSDYKPGYLQDTLTSIRRSRERAAASPSFSRTPSIRRSGNSKQKSLVKYENERPTLLRPTSLYYPSSSNNSYGKHS